MLEGGCFCGAVRYEAYGAPFNATLCHCSDCRRIAGAPTVAWFSVASQDFHFVKGEPRCFASSDRAVRSFCGDCGTCLTFQSTASPGEIDVTTCSLDEPERLPPLDCSHVGSRLSWVAHDALPSFTGSRLPGS